MRSSLGLKALGLCALVVGLAMAFVSVAQAEKGAFWLVNGKTFTEGLLPVIEAETDVNAVFQTTLGSKEVDVACPVVLLVEAHLVEPLGKLLAKAAFHECDFLTLSGGKATKILSCTPMAGGSSGLITSNRVEGLIKLHKNGTKEDTVMELKPAEAGGVFASIAMGEECGFGEIIKVGGVWFLEDCELLGLEDLVKHLLQENKALSKLTINGVNSASIDGSIWIFLGGAHKGMTWAGHPG